MFTSFGSSVKRTFRYSAMCLSALCLMVSPHFTIHAATDAETRIAANQALPIESNEITGWPEGPIVSAESAILMEANTGTILYSKNIHAREYPASTTKILTTLIASERCAMDEIVSFSYDAVFDTDRDSNHIAIDVGEELTMDQCLNAILIRSANEVSFAVAEHITGTSWQDFADIMNERATELGCVDSNFVNPNGLPDENHYTSAYDLAMIGRAFFANETLCKISTTRMLHIPPSDKQPDDILEVSSNQLIQGGTYAYPYLVGCKTGYTVAARSCLVSCAEKDGMKLICVVMKDESPLQYEDTISLFEYGFSNFDKINIYQTETKYNIDHTGFYSENDVFGNSSPLLSLNQDDYILLPKAARFEDAESTISYETENEQQAAVITYTYHTVFVGSASLEFAVSTAKSYSFENAEENMAVETAPPQTGEIPSVIVINIVKVLIGFACLAIIVFLLLLLRGFLKNYQISHRSTRFSWKHERRRRTRKYPSASPGLRAKRRAEKRQAKRLKKTNKKL